MVKVGKLLVKIARFISFLGPRNRDALKARLPCTAPSLLSLLAGWSTQVALRLNFELVKCVDSNLNGDKGDY